MNKYKETKFIMKITKFIVKNWLNHNNMTKR